MGVLEICISGQPICHYCNLFLYHLSVEKVSPISEIPVSQYKIFSTSTNEKVSLISKILVSQCEIFPTPTNEKAQPLYKFYIYTNCLPCH